MNALDRVTTALQQHGCAQRGRDWVCPAHQDKDPSLSVTESATGVVIHCHAGCATELILATLGLAMSDLFNEKVSTKSERVASYKYTDETGALLYEVVRFEPKDFRQRVPDAGGWRWSLNGVRRVLYRLPEVLAALGEGRRVFIVEGEKDADAFFERGEVATCNSGGAGKWRDEFAAVFRGATVVVVADKDATGRQHAKTVGDSLRGVAATCMIVEPKEGKDSFDHFRAGYNPNEFIDVGELELEQQDEDSENAVLGRLLTTAQLIELPAPTYIIDKLLVSDSIALIYGQPSAGKSFLALDWALSIASGQPWMEHSVVQGPVLYIVAEGLSGIGQRVIAWQAERGAEVGEVSWHPQAINLLDVGAVDELAAAVDAIQPVAVFVDTLARSMPGADENASISMSQVIEVLDRLRTLTRASVVAVHHTPKDGSSPRGHSSLLGGVQTAIKVVKEDGDITVSVEKQKDDAEIALKLRMRQSENSVVLYPSPMEDRDVVTNEVRLQKMIAEVAGAEGISSTTLYSLVVEDEKLMSRPTFFRARRALENRGVIINVGTQRQPRWAVDNQAVDS